MEYFFSHIGYILIAGVVIGLLGFAAVFFAEKSAELNQDYDDGDSGKPNPADDIACGFNCSSCGRFDSCSKDGKVVPLR